MVKDDKHRVYTYQIDLKKQLNSSQACSGIVRTFFVKVAINIQHNMPPCVLFNRNCVIYLWKL